MIGLQQTWQSSMYSCDGTEQSMLTEMLSEQYGQLISMSSLRYMGYEYPVEIYCILMAKACVPVVSTNAILTGEPE